jgi:hypothetical protein
MIASNCVALLNLYSWLPSYGENAVKCIFKEGDLYIEIYYDSDSANIEQKKILIFKMACYYSFSSIPGVNISSIKYDELADIGAVNEYKVSSAKDLWSLQFSSAKVFIRHFCIYFSSENKRLEVFAEDFTISDQG